MLLKKLIIKNLYGNLNINLDFNTDINLLVGINGGGKTSLINIIDWLTKPNIPKICSTEFDIIQLFFNHNKKDYTVLAIRTDECIKIHLKNASNEDDEGADIFHPITAPHISDIESQINFETTKIIKIEPEENEKELLDFLESLPNPTIISLDRTITAETQDSVYYERQDHPAIRVKKKPLSPLDYIKNITSQKYADFREKSQELDEELKARIVISALNSPIDFFSEKKIRILNKKEISSLQAKVKKYLSGSIKHENIIQTVDSFFDTASRFSENIKKNPAIKSSTINHFIGTQYQQIQSLAEAFNDYESQNSEAFDDLQKYLDAVNSFLQDSNKEIFFDAGAGKLFYKFIKAPEGNNEKKDVASLSSGERQLLILFTFLAFSAKESSIFIVDEPELSLHPKWQASFMSEFLKIKPQKSQLILATHSPDIVGNYKESCIIVRGNKK